MRLYDGRGPNPQIVRTFAAEKGITLDQVAVDIMKGENRGEPFVAKNPMGQVPALELESGAVVTEVTAICELLEELYPQPALIGSTAHERAMTRMWVRRFDLAVLEPFMLGFRATAMRRFFEARMPLMSKEAGAEMLALMTGRLREFDTMLDGRPWVLGERFSLADITLGSFLLFAHSARTPLPDGLRWMPDWLDRLRARGTFSA